MHNCSSVPCSVRPSPEWGRSEHVQVLTVNSGAEQVDKAEMGWGKGVPGTDDSVEVEKRSWKFSHAFDGWT